MTELILVDNSRGGAEPGSSAVRLAVVLEADPFDGAGTRQFLGFPEPLNWRTVDLKRLTGSGFLDRRVAIQLVSHGEGPLEHGQDSLWLPRNLSTRITDASGNEAILSSALRVVGSLDDRNVLALALYPYAFVDPRGAFQRSLLSEPELDPRGYVLGFGVPVPSEGTRVRGAGLERHPERAGVWSSVVMPEASRGYFGTTKTGLKVGHLPILLSTHFAAGEVTEKGADWDGPILHSLEDVGTLPAKSIFGIPGSEFLSIDVQGTLRETGSGLDAKRIAVDKSTFLGILAPLHDYVGEDQGTLSKEQKDATIDHEADAKNGLSRGNAGWVVRTQVTADHPPSEPPGATPGKKIAGGGPGGGGPPGPPGPAGPRGPRGGAGASSGAGCNKQAAPPGPVGGLLTDPQPAGELAGDGVTSVDLAPWARGTPICVRKPKGGVGIPGQGTPVEGAPTGIASGGGSATGGLAGLAATLAEEIPRLLLGSIPEPGSSARSLNPVDGIPGPNASATLMRDGKFVRIPNGHAPIGRNAAGDLVVLAEDGTEVIATDRTVGASWGVGDWNAANFPVPAFGERGGPITTEAMLKLMAHQLAAQQRVLNALTGGPQHLEGNLVAVARDRAGEPAGHNLSSDFSGDRDISEPTVALWSTLRAPARATDKTTGLVELGRHHQGSVDDRRPMVAFHDNTRSKGQQIRGVGNRSGVSRTGDTHARSLRAVRLLGEAAGSLLEAGFARVPGGALVSKFLDLLGTDGLLRVGQRIDDGTTRGGLAIAEQTATPTADDSMGSDRGFGRLILKEGGGAYVVAANGTVTDLAATGGGGSGVFGGTGALGNTTISSNTQITGIQNYADLTVNASVSLYPAVGRPALIKCTGNCTIAGAITADGKGDDGTAGTAGQAGVTDAGSVSHADDADDSIDSELTATAAGGGGGGGGGASGSGCSIGGGDGGDGGNGSQSALGSGGSLGGTGAPGSVTPGSGPAGGAGAVDAVDAFGYPDQFSDGLKMGGTRGLTPWIRGGAGGGGGGGGGSASTASGNSTTAGGAAGAVGSGAGTDNGDGGAGGAGTDWNNSAGNAAAGSGGGGGGGRGGGVIALEAGGDLEISVGGSLVARGGDGGAGGDGGSILDALGTGAPSATGPPGGGAGGGGGGLIVAAYRGTLTGDGTISAAGGAAGAAGGGSSIDIAKAPSARSSTAGRAGAAGEDGYAILVQVAEAA